MLSFRNILSGSAHGTKIDYYILHGRECKKMMFNSYTMCVQQRMEGFKNGYCKIIRQSVSILPFVF